MMNIMSDIKYKTTHLLSVLSPKDEGEERQIRINSSRSNSKKKNLFIVSNQNAKMFPPDFFIGMKEHSGFKTERNSSNSAFTIDNTQGIDKPKLTKHSLKVNTKFVIEASPRVISDYQKDLDEDKELLDMFDNSKFKDEKLKKQIRTETLSPITLNKNKNIYDLKCTGFEMIPEEDEERIKTEYESSKKFFENKTKENFNMNSIKRSLSKDEQQFKNTYKHSFQIENEKRENNFEDFEKMIQDKLALNTINTDNNKHIINGMTKENSKIKYEINSFNQNKKIRIVNDNTYDKKDDNNLNTLNIKDMKNQKTLAIKDLPGKIDKIGKIGKVASNQPIRQFSREKSLESNSTNENTNINDSGKKRIQKEIRERVNTPIFDFSKLNVKISGHSDLTSTEEISPAMTPNRKENDSLGVILNQKSNSNDSSKLSMGKNSAMDTNSKFSIKNPTYVTNSTNAANLINGNCKTNTIETLFSERRHSNNSRRSAGVSQFNKLNINNTNIITNFKPFTPPENTNKLPNLNNLYQPRRINKTPINNEIKNIFQDANNYKEDPVIKKKLDDIMQNIVDIRNVLSQKNLNRPKIGSAPQNNFDDSVNKNVGMTFMKAGSANSNLKRRLNLNSTTNNAIINTGNNLINPDLKNNILPRPKNKMPIKLIKNENVKNNELMI